MNPRRVRTLAELLQGIPGIVPFEDREVSGVSLDSRDVVPGGVFLARAGLSSHGLDYLDHALRLGAEVVLWESAPGRLQPAVPAGVLALEVPNLAQHAGAIAARFFGEPSSRLTLIGVTGTNGKTSVSHLTAQALSAWGQRCAVLGTLGYGFIDALEPASHTTPDPVRLQALLAQLAGSGADAVAMEVSSHALEQHRVAGAIFDTAVFTNLTRDHLDYHGDLANYAAAKKRLFHAAGLRNAVINADDTVGREILAELPATVRSIAFATHQESLEGVAAATTIFATGMRFDEQGLEIEVTVNGEYALLNAPLLGRFNALNLLAVFGVLLGLGLAPAAAARTLTGVRPVRGRMERLGGGSKPLVIVDYAHTPDALAQLLAAAREHCSGQLVCVFGCGGDRDRGKRPEMGGIAESLADRVIITDDNPRTEDGDAIVAEILAGMSSPTAATVERDRAAAIRIAIDAARKGDVVVIAGKGHEDYQIIGTRKRDFSDRETALAVLEGAS